MTGIRLSSREAIMEAAFQLFNEKPGASLADVAARAGVGRATLHRHFQSRDVLMIALARTARDELNAAVKAATAQAQTHTDGLKLALEAIIPLASRQWFLSHEAFADDDTILVEYRQDMAELASEIEAAKGEGSFAADIPTHWITKAYENLIYAAWEMVRDGEATPKQAADLAWKTLISGMSGDQQ